VTAAGKIWGCDFHDRCCSGLGRVSLGRRRRAVSEWDSDASRRA